MPAVTVIIPTYNAARFLPAAVQSVLDQTWTDWELIVVDDGSTDETADLFSTMFRDSRIRRIVQPNQGDAAARNTGILASTSPLIAFLDADDLWKPDKLHQQVRVLQERAEIDVVYCGIEIVTLAADGSSRLRQVVEPPDLLEATLYEELLIRNIVTGSHSSVMLRRSAIDATGLFDPRFRISDFDLWIRLALRHAFYGIREPLVVIRKHGDNSSNDKIMMSDNHLRHYCKLRQEVPREFQRLLSTAAISRFWWLTLGLVRRRHWMQACRTAGVMCQCVLSHPLALGRLIGRAWPASGGPSGHQCDTPVPGLLFPRIQ